jgi:tRNA A37 methylthiotransferase MiaB
MYCKPSEVLSSRLVDYLHRNGHEVVPQLRQADYVFVNSCGYDDIHERISLELYRNAFRDKTPSTRVIAVGCLNRIDPDLLRREFPELVLVDDIEQLDRWFLTGAPDRQVPAREVREAICDEHLYRHIHHLEEPQETESLRTRAFFAAAGGAARVARWLGTDRLDALHLDPILDHTSYASKLSVQIGSGCVGTCSYCVIKKAKGAPASRPIDDILADVAENRSGKRLLQLVADDCGSFGVDTGDTLFELVGQLTSRFPDLPINLTYINPYWMQRHPDEYLAMFAESPIASANISLQSGSDRILQQMSRHYDAATVLELVDRVKVISPQTMIYTHLLLGFPSESWHDFRLTARAARHFHYLTCFLYSPRRGSAAADLPDDVPHAVKVARKRIIHSMYVGRLVKGAVGG